MSNPITGEFYYRNLTAFSQGVISVTLVMPQFLERFPEVSEAAAGAGFYKGLMTGMIELGALLGRITLYSPEDEC